MKPEIEKMIEGGKKHGVDMSWLRAPAAGGTQAPGLGAVGRLSPGAADLLQSVRQTQTQTPAYIPFPGGTPTQARRQADEASRQFEVGHEFDREQFDWRRGTDERDFEANEAYRQAQLALQQLQVAGGGGAAGGAGATGVAGPRDATLTERDRIPASAAGKRMIEDIRSNPDISLGQWISAVRGEPEIRSALIEEGIDVNEFISFIEEQYTLYHLLEAMSRVGQNVQPWDYGQDLRQRQDLIKKYNPWQKPAAEPAAPEGEAQQWWGSMGADQQQTIKNQLVAGWPEITKNNIDNLTPEQIKAAYDKLLTR